MDRRESDCLAPEKISSSGRQMGKEIEILGGFSTAGINFLLDSKIIRIVKR